MRRVDLSIPRGDTAEFLLTCTVPNLEDPFDDDLLVDLTDATIRFTAKRRIADPDNDIVFQITNGSGVSLRDQVEFRGQAIVTISGTHTATLPADRKTYLVYDVEVTEANTKDWTTQMGNLEVFPTVRAS